MADQEWWSGVAEKNACLSLYTFCGSSAFTERQSYFMRSDSMMQILLELGLASFNTVLLT